MDSKNERACDRRASAGEFTSPERAGGAGGRQAPRSNGDALDDSWFDRVEIRAVAAELRARLARAYRAQAGDNEAPAIAMATPGLDDSWFR